MGVAPGCCPAQSLVSPTSPAWPRWSAHALVPAASLVTTCAGVHTGMNQALGHPDGVSESPECDQHTCYPFKADKRLCLEQKGERRKERGRKEGGERGEGLVTQGAL